MEKGVYVLQETGKDKQLTLKCFYGPEYVTIEARCMDPLKSNVIAQWNITDNGCWSIYGPYECFKTTELAQVKIRTCFRITSHLTHIHNVTFNCNLVNKKLTFYSELISWHNKLMSFSISLTVDILDWTAFIFGNCFYYSSYDGNCIIEFFCLGITIESHLNREKSVFNFSLSITYYFFFLIETFHRIMKYYYFR